MRRDEYGQDTLASRSRIKSYDAAQYSNVENRVWTYHCSYNVLHNPGKQYALLDELVTSGDTGLKWYSEWKIRLLLLNNVLSDHLKFHLEIDWHKGCIVCAKFQFYTSLRWQNLAWLIELQQLQQNRAKLIEAMTSRSSPLLPNNLTPI